MKRSSTIRLLFLVYSALMLWLLFGKRWDGGDISFGNTGENLNLVPLETIRLYVGLLKNSTRESLIRHAIVNLVGNVVMFIPLGWFLPRIWIRLQGLFKTLLLSFGLICLVELVQYVTALGSCDVDDLMLNLLGVYFGYGIWRLGHRK